MPTFLTETANGLRRWEADDFDHAREQHVVAFPVDNSDLSAMPEAARENIARAGVDTLFPERIQHVWRVLDEGQYEAEGCNLYTRRDGLHVGRPFTDAERVDSERRSKSYAAFMDAATAEWQSLIDAISNLLPGDRAAGLWQTGGMCLAIGWALEDAGEGKTVEDGAYAMLTVEDDTLPPTRAEAINKYERGAGYALGVYIDGDEAISGEGALVTFPMLDARQGDDGHAAVQLTKTAEALLDARRSIIAQSPS